MHTAHCHNKSTILSLTWKPSKPPSIKQTTPSIKNFIPKKIPSGIKLKRQHTRSSVINAFPKMTSSHRFASSSQTSKSMIQQHRPTVRISWKKKPSSLSWAIILSLKQQSIKRKNSSRKPSTQIKSLNPTPQQKSQSSMTTNTCESQQPNPIHPVNKRNNN